MWTSVKAITQTILQVLLPTECSLCNTVQDHILCDTCLHQLPWRQHRCEDIPMIDEVWSYLPYNEDLKKIIGTIKFEHWKKLALRLGEGLKSFSPTPPCHTSDIWCPVPTHDSRLRLRGFNQVDSLFQPAITSWGVPYESDLLKRCKATPPLFNLSTEKRRHELAGAFTLKKTRHCRDTSVMIVDDILTSGATLREIGRSLRHHGAKTIKAVCLCETEK